ncbi:CBS domain-containing protein [Nocardia otitidiscaviarum]|uniref:CBS domain-containing protein n=1 Tax=Nocardia TaxID=1817 RepID=UPI0004A784D7|nr:MULTISPECIES: CBS domain-containing protein [Nocardia]MBF6132775.1 CBS domain-containing protein [Nocardia otitidiscaviarum]MBF6238968.1 CBS domain-containing protein [Nocardia otitidiscaviarum]MBF6486194.1 CBS domain-containing protein [Nocardia otitidiscaviarum]
MHAAQLAEEFPVVSLDTDALEAAGLMAEHRLPGIMVMGPDGCPAAVLAAWQVVRFIIPKYVQDDPSLAGVLDEPMCDKTVKRLRGKKVRDVMPDKPGGIPTARPDDTIVEVAATMARHRSPIVAVLDGRRLLGVVTSSRLLAAALQV